MNKFNRIIVKITGGQCDTCQNRKIPHFLDSENLKFFHIKKRKFLRIPENPGIPYPLSPPLRKYHCKHFEHAHNNDDTPCKQYDLSINTRIAMASRKIKPQFSNKSIESFLMFAVIEQAYHDFIKYNKKEDREFLSNTIPHAEICEVSSTWIKETLIDCGFNLKKEGKNYG